ncbi:MAG: S8 family peptidase [Lachnospiraceae bacterium]
MDSQKRENLLNLALDVSDVEREKSNILNIGFDKVEKTWEVIVKYHGDLLAYEKDNILIEILVAGYAIVTLPESEMEYFTNIELVEFIEKPKAFTFTMFEEKVSSCILPVIQGVDGLTGKGVLVGIIDSGIDYYLKDFQNDQGSRILYLWDQSGIGKTPEGFYLGAEYTKEEIDFALKQNTYEGALQIVPSLDVSGHGTSVAAICAGSNQEKRLQGVAIDSELLVVKLGIPKENGFPRTTEIMRALTYLIQKARELRKPIAINLSFGNTYGPHDGSSLLEQFIDTVSQEGKCSICVGSGNEGASGGHAEETISDKELDIEFSIGEYEVSTNLQMWKMYGDLFETVLVTPDGSQFIIEGMREGTKRLIYKNMTILVYIGMPMPYSVNQEIFFDFIANDSYLERGIWKLKLRPYKIISGNVQCYLPSSGIRNLSTRFFKPSPSLTLTIPSTASKVITVGAYQIEYEAYADFSGRGDFINDNTSSIRTLVKPDLVAPGVAIQTVGPRGNETTVTGTSFATPIVTGSVALLMEYGIIKGNDPYLYGEKLKAFLIKGAKRLPGYRKWPNPQVGWGALCVEDSIKN